MNVATKMHYVFTCHTSLYDSHHYITVVNCTVGVFIYLKASNPAFGICIAVFGCGAFLFILYHLNYNLIPLIVDGNTEGNYIGLMLNLLLVAAEFSVKPPIVDPLI